MDSTENIPEGLSASACSEDWTKGYSKNGYEASESEVRSDGGTHGLNAEVSDPAT